MALSRHALWVGLHLQLYISALLACTCTGEALVQGHRHPQGVDAVVASHINGSAIEEQLRTLATMSDGIPPGVTRILFTQADVTARNYVKRLMQDAGLIVKEDLMGSIFGTLQGTDVSAPAVATGSHCDAIPNSGAYDGTVGVLGGIAALKAMKMAGYQPIRSIHVIYFTSEEPTRFGLSCLGSRAMSGAMTEASLAALRDANGSSFLEAARHAQLESLATSEAEALSGSRLTDMNISSFVELHIEQGPQLEALGIPIGIVTSIAAPATVKVTFRGTGGHAGSLLMHQRLDPSIAAASLALRVEATAKQSGASDTVATVGQWLIYPNAVNSVPENVTLMIDVRDIDGVRRDTTVVRIINAAKGIARQILKADSPALDDDTNILDMPFALKTETLEIEVINSDKPAMCSPSIIQAIQEAAGALHLESHKMISRAYHDALFMSRITPMGMIFIPCAGGKSHRPDEFASTIDIEAGVKVLTGTLIRLAGGRGGGDLKRGAFGTKHPNDEL